MKKEEVPQNISAFPLGKENTGFKQYFTGESWLAPLTSNKDLNVPMSNVTFEPGCRNNWHSHTGGQLLIAVGGVGYYQERGKAARRLLPGDFFAGVHHIVAQLADEIHPPPKVDADNVAEVLGIDEADQLVVVRHRQRTVHGIHPFDGKLHRAPAVPHAGSRVYM